ncbi:ethanolamine ammonia-lyase [Herbaspirillum sp. meg3]|uniref:ethanolamine ammonia-lyase subunit EutC n=1 Tax=Herbaspirillum sp. meg3 TaxID=2025949 RepID=UPI000B997B14|nr:ethanolamine ammonia-lyase subunit EutC [Herbaspirillum sp. meg3]ASU38834.1 ethanolamine ammonia-lyase [Herbaspirillum sp. meg3]
MENDKSPVINNPWQMLREFTAARIALGRAGVSLPTSPQLAFQLAHAQARDAVHLALDADQLRRHLLDVGIGGAEACLVLDTAAGDRLTYLQRPDLGRRLSEASRNALASAMQAQGEDVSYDLAVVVADGLSSLAIARNAVPFLSALQPRIAKHGWKQAPLTIVRQGRVAVGDEVGYLLRARLVVVLIGERPGLSSPDSMGLYLSWMPRVGMADSERNCISNVRTEGMRYDEAAFKLEYLLSEATRRQLSGVGLKDESGRSAEVGAPTRNFLLSEG